MTTGWIEETFRKPPAPRQLTNITSGIDHYLESDQIAVSQKFDGKRVMICRDTDSILAIGRSGSETDIPDSLSKTFMRVRPHWVFDGELVGDTYYAFDVISLPERQNICGWIWKDRQELLDTVLSEFDDNVKVVRQVYGYKKADFYQEALDAKAEGIVFANTHGIYLPGKRNNSIAKFKFVKDVDCVVTDVSVNGKDNLELSLYDNNNQLVPVGKVSALTGDGAKTDITVGDVVSVNFLYVTDSMKLYQPTKPKLRLDKQAAECKLWQLEDYITDKKAVV